ncbi:MAG TPA: hypothetical protein VK435_11275, partial [Thermodesulfovibrionales bacterium]|nr:hypothetical protein [Thermodesulfovibrionales bacterium]
TRETSHKTFVLNDWETRDDIVAHRDLYVWLPRLDQLQMLVDWTLWEFKITKDSEIKMLYTAISEDVRSGSVSGTSLGQVWLAFIMKAKYNKTWDPKESRWR